MFIMKKVTAYHQNGGLYQLANKAGGGTRFHLLCKPETDGPH